MVCLFNCVLALAMNLDLPSFFREFERYDFDRVVNLSINLTCLESRQSIPFVRLRQLLA